MGEEGIWPAIGDGGRGYSAGSGVLLMTLALTLYWACQTELSFAPHGDGEFWYVSNVFASLAYAVGLLVAGRLSEQVRSRTYLIPCAGCIAAATAVQLVILPGCAAGGLVGIVLFVVRNVLMVVGMTGFIASLFARLAAFEEPSDRTFVVLVSMVLSLLVYQGVAGLGHPADYVCAVIEPALSCAALIASWAYAGDTAGRQAGERPYEDADFVVGGGSVGWRVLLGIFVIAVGLNFVRVLVESLPLGVSPTYSEASSVVILCLAVAAAVEVALKRPLHKVAPVIIAALASLTVISAFAGVPFSTVSAPLAMAAYLYYAAFFWRLSANLAQGSSGRVVSIAYAVLGVNSLGLVVGGWMARTASGLAQTGFVMVAMLVAYAICIAGIAITRLDFSGGRRAAGPVADAMLAAVPTPAVGGLTPKETEVAAMAAGGMTLREIADEMSTSVNTVKTHMVHVYQKLDVHSRDELKAALRAPRAD